jgi:hypothetical protein
MSLITSYIEEINSQIRALAESFEACRAFVRFFACKQMMKRIWLVVKMRMEKASTCMGVSVLFHVAFLMESFLARMERAQKWSVSGMDHHMG